MVNGGFYKNVNCYFTNEGRTTFAKQDNGIKFSKLGAVVFSDKNQSLINAIKAENFDAIDNLSLKQLNYYTQLIFGTVKYSYDGSTYTPDNTEDVEDAIKNPTKCLPIDISYERNSDETYFSYDFTLKTNSLNIDSSTGADFNFDGFALLGIPYKSTINDRIEGLIEPQTPTVLAIIYFENDNEKLQILYNQSDIVAMTVELHISLKDEIYLGAIKEYVDTNGNPVENNIATRNLVGLRKVNDGLNNRDSDTDSIGSDTNVLISKLDTDTTTAYDSFAKLNIMTEAVNDLSAAVPQIMLAQTQSGNSEKVWNGDRLNIKYTSGNDCGYFSISEVTGNTRQRINFDLFGQNNIYHTVLTGVYGNSFIYAKSNRLTDNVNNISFIHSDYNTFENSGMSGISFVNSNFNTIKAATGTGDDRHAYVKNVSLYNSNNNTYRPQYYSYLNSKNERVNKKGLISNSLLLNSHYNYIKGRNALPYADQEFYEPNSTIINSMSSFYNLHQDQTLTMIGSTYSFINQASGNIIGIGDGLLQTGGHGDRIILGHYNRNTEDPNEVLVVGDGRMNQYYIKGLVSGIKNWNTKITAYETILENISGDGDPDLKSNYYRHNIFTVNKNGYITISDYDTNRSARYGYDGITAWSEDGETKYEIPFEALWNKTNIKNFYAENTSDLLKYQIAADNIISTVPSTTAVILYNKTESTPNIPFSAYVNTTGTINVSNDSEDFTELFKPLENNKIFTITYYPKTSTNSPMCLIWHYRIPGTTNITSAYSLVKPYTCKRLIYQGPNQNEGAVANQLSGFIEIS